MISRTDKRFKFVIFFMCLLLVVTSIMPMLVINESKAAGDTVTVYFDTGGSGHASNGWSNDMTVYYDVSSTKDGNDQGGTSLYFTEQMTVTTLASVRDPDNSNAKLWKVELPTSDVGKYISFSGFSGNQSHWNRTSRRDGPQVKDNIVIYATGNEQDGYWQSWYTTLKTAKTDYAGKTFQIANMTSQSVAFDLLYYSDDGTNIYLSSYTDHAEQVISARNFGVTYTIPSVASGTTPYSGIKIIRRQINGSNDPYSDLDNYNDDTVISGIYSNSETGTLIKDYPFTNDLSQSKCIGKVLKYGITQFGTTKPQYADDADNKTLSFNTDPLSQPAAVSGKTLYLEKGTGEKKGFAQYGDAGNIKVVVGGTVDHYTGAITGGTSYNVTCLDPGGNPDKASGNASYVVNDFPNLSAGTIFTIRCYDSANGKYDIYNLVWDDDSKDLCVLAFGDVAQVTDTRTVQGINKMPNGQSYMTVKSDFFDYQYDKFNYSYKLVTWTGGNSSNNYKATWGTESQASTHNNEFANAKRPYSAINEAISSSAYGNSSNAIPMYLGQFWMPLYDGKDNFYGQRITENSDYDTSSDVYTSGNKPRAGHNKPSEMYVSAGGDGKAYEGNMGFGNVLNNYKWGANLAFRTDTQATGTYMPYDAVAQGLVGDYLLDSSGNVSKSGKLMAKNSTSSNLITVPYFDTDWWNNTYVTPSQTNTKVNMSSYLKEYDGLDFPFFETAAENLTFKNGYDAQAHLLSDTNKKYSGNYYLFDSTQHSVYVNTSGSNTVLDKDNTASKLVYDNYGTDGWAEDTDHGRTYGLFPFNQPTNGTYNDRSDLHYGYGIRYDIDFYMTETGTVNGKADGTPITFTFQGDDDVWVFLDGKLLLDMGGAHKNALGEINFDTKQTWISAVGQANSSSIVSNNKTDNTLNDTSGAMLKRARTDVTKSFNTEDWASRLTEGEHTITMFYMERGMLNSNLYCMFNLPTNITKVQLQEDTDFGKVNAGFSTATKYVADSDIFNYSFENKNTENVLGSSYEVPVIGTTNRSNSEGGTDTNGNPKKTALNNTETIGTRLETRTRQVYDGSHLYLDTSNTYGRSTNDWESDGAEFAAYFYNTGGKNVSLKFMTSVGEGTHLYKCDYISNMLGVYFFRLPGGYNYEGKDKTFDNNDWNLNWNAANNYIKSINGRTNKTNGWWNQTAGGSDLDYTKNRFVLEWKDVGSLDAPGYGANVSVEESYQVSVPATDNHNFETEVAAGSNGYKPLVSTTDGSVGVTYQLEDMFALSGTNTVPVTFDTRQYNSSGNANIISLQYGEMATLSRQFSANSSIRVTQLDKLSSPTMSDAVNGSRLSDSDYVDLSDGRKVSDYYTTFVKTGSNENMGGLTMLPSPGIYKGEDVANISTPTVKHADDMYETGEGTAKTLKSGLSNYSNNSVINLQRSTNEQTKDISTTFTLADPEQATNTNVYLRQVIVNAVNTADLRLAKYMTAVDVPASKKFTFTIRFTGVFGDDSSAAVSKINTAGISYYKNDGTTAYTFGSNPDSFTYNDSTKTVTVLLGANESITIKGIPVGTKYLIEEADDTDYTLDQSSSKNLEFDSNGKITVTEITSDTEADVFNKVKTGAIRLRKNLLDTSNQAITSTDEFEFIVTVTSIPSDKGSVGSYPITAHLAGTPNTKTQVLWDKDVNNVYSLKINIKPSVRTGTPSYANDVILEGFPVGLVYDVSETAKAGYTQQGNVSFSDSNKTVNDYYLGAGEAISSGESNDSSIDLIEITNKEIPKGSLTITKSWKESDGTNDLSAERMTELNVVTSIGVVLYYSSDSGSTWQKAKDIDNTDVSDITLQSEDSWTQTITRLPTNYTYKIVEKNKEGTAELGTNESYDDRFTVIYSSNVTLASNGSTGNLTVTNKFNPQQIVMPETGGTILIYLLPFGIIAIALSGAAMIIYKKKLQGYSLLFGRKRR